MTLEAKIVDLIKANNVLAKKYSDTISNLNTMALVQYDMVIGPGVSVVGGPSFFANFSDAQSFISSERVAGRLSRPVVVFVAHFNFVNNIDLIESHVSYVFSQKNYFKSDTGSFFTAKNVEGVVIQHGLFENTGGDGGGIRQLFVNDPASPARHCSLIGARARNFGESEALGWNASSMIVERT